MKYKYMELWAILTERRTRNAMVDKIHRKSVEGGGCAL